MDTNATPPSELTFTGTFDMSYAPADALIEGDTKRFIAMNTHGRVTVSPEVDAPLEMKRLKGSKVVRPAPGGCDVSDFWVSVLSPELEVRGSVSTQFTGTDVLPADDCLAWATRVGEEGYLLELTDVPYQDGGVASRVVIDMRPKASNQ